MNIIKGKRAGLERELLAAMLTPGAERKAEALKARLQRRGTGKLKIVSDPASRPAPTEAGD